MPSASWTARANAQSVPELRQAVVEFAYDHGVPEPRLSEIRLAVSEAVTNAVVHGFRGRMDGTVNVSVNMGAPGWVDRSAVVLSIEVLNVPHAPEADQVSVDDLGYKDDGISHVTTRLGFQDQIDVPRP
jgi:two-component sensor histidine kinase